MIDEEVICLCGIHALHDESKAGSVVRARSGWKNNKSEDTLEMEDADATPPFAHLETQKSPQEHRR